MEIVETTQTCTAHRLSCVEQGEEVGRVYLYIISNDLHNQPYGLLEDVFVKEEYRGKGYWKQLWQQVLALAKKEQCYKILATSRFSRDAVHSMYEKLGFQKHGVEFRIDL